MSIAVMKSLFCDGLDGNCPAWTGESDMLAPALRRWARMHGWRRRGGKDLCPECASGTVHCCGFHTAECGTPARGVRPCCDNCPDRTSHDAPGVGCGSEGGQQQ